MFERTYGGLVEVSAPMYKFVGEVSLMQNHFRMGTVSVEVYAEDTAKAEQKVNSLGLFPEKLPNEHFLFKWFSAVEEFSC